LRLPVVPIDGAKVWGEKKIIRILVNYFRLYSFVNICWQVKNDGIKKKEALFILNWG
jgi:hypothetical protein